MVGDVGQYVLSALFPTKQQSLPDHLLVSHFQFLSYTFVFLLNLVASQLRIIMGVNKKQLIDQFILILLFKQILNLCNCVTWRCSQLWLKNLSNFGVGRTLSYIIGPSPWVIRKTHLYAWSKRRSGTSVARASIFALVKYVYCRLRLGKWPQ